MGVQGLTKVINEHASRAITQHTISDYFGRKVAIDASMSIYQFLIAVRSEDGTSLADQSGQTTRTIRMVECGIKPIYVFDGVPPKLKTMELDHRLMKREDANKEVLFAQASDQPEAIGKFMKRTVKVTKEHIVEAKKLLTFMGIPFIQAPSEAEAQCAALVKAGLVYATGSEDMDTLTFGSSILLRHLTFSETRKIPITEIQLDMVLEGLNLTMDQFIDLCILLGCDYCDSIKGIGPHKAIKLLNEFGSLDKIVEHFKLDPSCKFEIPENFPYMEARAFFKSPTILDASQVEPLLKGGDILYEELINFLVVEKGFNEERIKAGIKKLEKNVLQPTQGRIDSFFKRNTVLSDTKIEKKIRKK